MKNKKFVVKNSNVICFPIEVKVREFIPKIFLAYKLIKKTNFKVIFASQRHITNKLRFENCLWFDKNTFYKQREKFPIHLDNKIIMLDEEGPISFFGKATLNLRYHINIAKQIDTFLFAGENDVKYLNYKFLKHKYKIFGHPKFDLLKNDNLGIYEKDIRKIKAKYGDFLFIPGHWSLNKNYENLKKNAKLLFPNKIERHKFLKNCEVYLNNYHSLLDLVKKIAVQNPDLKIIFRRHPTENEFLIKNYFKDKPTNLKLIMNNNITPWIMACKYYLHSGCQSYLEALSLNKKIICYYPFKYRHTNNFYLSKPIFYKEQECLNFFKMKLINKLFFSDNKNILYAVKNIKKNFYFYKKFSNYLNKIFKLNNSNIIFKSETKNVSILSFIYYLLSNLKSFLTKIKIIFLFSKFFSYEDLISKETKNNKFGSLLKSEIEHYLDIFKKIDKSNNEIIVKKLSKNVFLLRNKTYLI